MTTLASHPEQQAKARHAWRRGLAGLVATLLLATSLPSAAIAPVEREYADAVKSFRAGRTAEAFGRFIDLANRGDVDAARIALFLHAYGAVLFDKQWDADQRDVAYWALLVRNSGNSARPLPEFQPTVLTPSKPGSRPAAAKRRGEAKANTRVAAD